MPNAFTLHRADGEAGRPRSLARCSPKPDLLEEGHEVVHEVLLDDLSVVPECDCVELKVEASAGGRNLPAIGGLHGPGHCSPEASDRAGPVSRGKEDSVGSVVETLVGKRSEEVNRLLRVVL